MRDPEFIELKKRFIKAFLVALIFTIPMLLFVINRLGPKQSKLINSINNKEDIVVLVVEDECRKCEDIDKFLKDNKVKFFKINKSRENDYNIFLKKIDMSDRDITSPTVIYIKEGVLNSSLVSASKKELLEYIDYNQLSHTK